MSTRRRTEPFLPENRLSIVLGSFDRRDFTAHVERAEQEVCLIAQVLGQSIHIDIEELIRRCRQDETEIFGQCREIGWLALRIVESARLAKRPELAEAAEGVWEMIDALSTRGVWHTDALKVHVTALLALTATDGVEAEERRTIALELLKMRQAVGAKPCG